MAPRYIIHMGPMKTASTYVQECLTAARQDLLHDGICYPEELLAENNRFMHLPVFYALLRKREDALGQVFAKLNGEGHRIVVLSCEHFHFLPPDAFRKLRDLTGADDFRIVYTCRRWSDRIGSLWNHSLFTGGMQSLPEFYLALLGAEPLNYYTKWMKESGGGADVDYSLTWHMLADIFGREALAILPYSAIMDRGGDVFETFCRDILEIAEPPKTKLSGQRRWVSMPTDAQEIVRVLNEMHFKATGEMHGAMSVPFMRGRKKLDAERIAGAIATETATLRVDDRESQFDAPYAAMSKYIDRVIGSEVVFTRGAKQVPYVRPAYMLHDGVKEDYDRLYRTIASNLPK